MSVRWGLIVEETVGWGERRTGSARELERLTGTREEAMARLERRARTYAPEHPARPVATWLYRTDDGFLQINQGSGRSYGCRFSLGELLHDSGEAEQEAAAAREAEKQRRKEEKAAERAGKPHRWGLRG